MRKLGSLVLALLILVLSVIPAFAQERPSVLEILENDADGRFTTLVAAIDAAGLREALEAEGPFTILAPTNDAFLAALETMGVSPEQALLLGEGLQPILLKHVIAGQYFFRNLTGGPTVETLSGESVTFNLTDGVFTVNGVGISDPDQLYAIEDGEILVCRITAPSWAPVFPRIKAAVSDVGGMMAHTAIICREYGLPAVVGTGFATARVKTGDLIEVDGNIGLVRILEEAQA